MLPFLFILVAFGAWLVTGLAFLTLTGRDTSRVGVALSAPVLGSLVYLVPCFLLNEAGLGLSGAVVYPVLGPLFLASIAIVAWRRPRLPIDTVFVFACSALALVLVGRPFLSFGFNWISNANDDMANYVLSATWLQHHGLLSKSDLAAISDGRLYSSSLARLHRVGSRPGADIMLASYSSFSGRFPYQMFMPFILAAHMTLVTSTAVLAAQGTRRRLAPLLAALLVALSPLASFGSLQQLLPQTWGLSIAAVFVSLVMSPDLYARRVDRGTLVTVALLLAGLILVYVELASTLAIGYAIFLIVLFATHRASVKNAARFWLIPAAFTLLLLNAYVIPMLSYVGGQAGAGVKSGPNINIFGFVGIPAALPAILGLQDLPAGPHSKYMSASIVFAIVVFALTVVAAAITARRFVAASFVLLAYLLLGAYLGLNSSFFGLYKLFMYAQPFLAAAFAVWLVRLFRPRLLALVLLACVPLGIAATRVQAKYVHASRDPIDLSGASSNTLLPAFRKIYRTSPQPVVSITDNPTLGKLEAASIGNGRLFYASKYLFGGFIDPYATGWRRANFPIVRGSKVVQDAFLINTAADKSFRASQCTVVFPGYPESVFNRTRFTGRAQKLVTRHCEDLKNLLFFQSSEYGQGYYLPTIRRYVSNWQLEPDYFYPGASMSGFGQYTLIRVLGTHGPIRIVLDFTKTVFGTRDRALPHATLVGATTVSFPVVGQGSARVVSPPVVPKIFGGDSYVLLNMNQPGTFPLYKRSGVQALYGRSIPIDPRYLTSYVRDVSIQGPTDNPAPESLSHFPADLANPNLEYSGIYENGFLSRRSFFRLAGGPATTLHLTVSSIGIRDQRVRVLVDGSPVRTAAINASRNATTTLLIRIPRSAGPRVVGLRWSRQAPIGPADNKLAAAFLGYLGVGSAGG